jgi:hypothetical protein
MHWPFVRATLVLVLLVCGVFGHGWHAQDAAPASTVTHAPQHTASGVDSAMAGHSTDSAVAHHTAPSSTDTAARDGHQPNDHACGTAWAADKSHSPAALALCKTASPADNSGRGELPVAAPAIWSGRSLLLLQCVSRT